MKYIKQLVIIFSITFLGEVLHTFIPLPIPASIYGLLLMLACLQTKIVKLEQVKSTGDFLLEVMPVMFIPAAVGLINVWYDITDILLPIIIITVLTTVLVMAATGKMTDFILERDRRSDYERSNK
ncbi:MAG: CidA/LrgA family protein [Sedimentibacter sp.]